MAETDDVGKEQKLESARRFCDLMEEEEDISIAQVYYIYKRHKYYPKLYPYQHPPFRYIGL